MLFVETDETTPIAVAEPAHIKERTEKKTPIRRFDAEKDTYVNGRLNDALLATTLIGKQLGKGASRITYQMVQAPLGEVHDTATDVLNDLYPSPDGKPRKWIIKVNMFETVNMVKHAKRIENPGNTEPEDVNAVSAVEVDSKIVYNNIGRLAEANCAEHMRLHAGFPNFARSFTSDSCKVLPEYTGINTVWLPKGDVAIMAGADRKSAAASNRELMLVPIRSSFQPEMETQGLSMSSGSWELGIVNDSKVETVDGKQIDTQMLSEKIEILNDLNDAFLFEEETALQKMTPEYIRAALGQMGEPAKDLLEVLNIVDETDNSEGIQARAAVIDFVKSAIRYTDNNDAILDTHGSDNVRLIVENGKVKVELVDAFSPEFEDALKKTRMAFEFLRTYARNSSLRGYRHEDIPYVLQTTSYVRTINLLAHYLGLNERIHLLDDPLVPHTIGSKRELVEDLQDGGARFVQTNLEYLAYTEEVPEFNILN